MTNISKKEGYLLTTIPFSGFYETMWSEYFDRDNEFYFHSDDKPELCESEIQGIVDEMENTINHQATREAIASEYVNQFNHYYDTSLEFESLQSPREYNFTTDRIFCHISIDEFKRIYRACDKVKLSEYIKDKFTSCDGFTPFYSNDLNDWIVEGLVNFDHNQIGTIIEAWLIEYHIDLKEHGYIEQALECDLLDACLISEKVVYE